MTTSVQDNKVTLECDGAETEFEFSFKYFANTDIKVYVLTAGTVVTEADLVAEGTDYTLSSADKALGGTITFNVAPADSKQVFILRKMPLTQENPFKPNTNFPEQIIETSLDKLTMITQELHETDQRCIKLAINSELTDILIPTPEANKSWKWDPTGTFLVNTLYDVDDAIVLASQSAIDAGMSEDAAAASALAALNSKNKILNDDGFIAVAADLEGPNNIGAVASDLIKINTVADNIVAVDTVSDNIANVNTVNTNIVDVNTVATDIADVNTCADNMGAILDAPTQAGNALQSANNAAQSASDAAALANFHASIEKFDTAEADEAVIWDSAVNGYKKIKVSVLRTAKTLERYCVNSGPLVGGVFPTLVRSTGSSLIFSINTAEEKISKITANSTVVFVLTNLGCIYKSTDGGVTWVLKSTGNTTFNLLANTSGSTSLYALASTGAVYYSSDSGATWALKSTNAAFTYITAYSGGLIYALTATGQVYLSTDYGVTWLLKSTNSAFIKITCVSNYLYALTATGAVYYSSDSGATWALKSTTATFTHIDSSSDYTSLYASTSVGTIYLSIDYGATWTLKYTNNLLTQVAASSNAVYALLSDYSLYYSSNSGTTWSFKSMNVSLANGKALLLTFPNGKTYCISSVAQLIVGASGDIIIREADLTPTGATTTIGGIVYPTYTATATLVTAGVVEQKTAPANVNGKRWLATSVQPNIPYVGDGSNWALEQYVPIGSETYSSGVTAVVTRPYNKGPLLTNFEYATLAIGSAVSTAVSVAGVCYAVSSASFVTSGTGNFSWANGVATCLVAGTYQVDYTSSVYCGTAAKKLAMCVFKNGALSGAGYSTEYAATANQPVSLSSKVLIALVAGDTLQLGISNLTTALATLIDCCTFSIIELL